MAHVSKLALVALFAINTLLHSQHAVGQTLNDLKGLSVRSVWNLQLKFRKPGTSNDFNVSVHVDRNLYISLKGNIFVYQDFPAPRVGVLEIDRAYPRPTIWSNQLFTWTLVNGHLTLVDQFLKGERVFTYVIDPRALTCMLNAHDEPDPASHTMVDLGPSGPFETLSMGFAGSTCTVFRGNIFAGDQ